jgi:hypothetical protein
MLRDPRSRSKDWKALDRVIGEPGRSADKYSRTGSFNLRQLSTTERIAATFGPACGLPMCNQFFRPRATGRMEFSARLVLSSNSGYSKKRVSFFHSVSAYWQALLSALEGNATDCAASMLLRISSRRGLAVS